MLSSLRSLSFRRLCTEAPKLPVCCQLGPYEVVVDKSKPWMSWCSCGLSTKHADGLPLCNGAHKGTTMKPIRVMTENIPPGTKLYFCGCKQTKDPNGFCDGTHTNLAPATK
jgi:CDGSH-type Zn-finger protein